MKNFLLYLWQLPQNLLGLLVIFFTRAKYNDIDDNKKNNYWLSHKFGYFGVSLGKYIIFGNGTVSVTSVKHEQGHQKQSLYFGWLYLILVGLPSIARNIWDIIAHNNWQEEDRIKWYYNGYPEKQADKYGGVVR